MRWVAGLLLVGCTSRPTSPASLSPESRTAEVEAARIADDLVWIASPRPPGSPHWQAVQDRCGARLASFGFAVERHAYDSGVNIIGIRPGSRIPDERVVLSAHYDSTEGCPGADDNASGVAGVLEAARVLAARTYARTLVVACWDEEERGLVGSTEYVTRARERSEQIVASYVFEMIGYRSDEPGSQQVDPRLALVFPDQARAIADREHRGDFIAAIHDLASATTIADFQAAARERELPVIALPVPDVLKQSPAARDLRRSDHAPFWDAGYPAVMLTDTAEFRNPHYHCRQGPDVVEDLDLAFATAIVATTVQAVATTLDR
jgi:Zn-dependent M28 family amino/carboxypeptidase